MCKLVTWKVMFKYFMLHLKIIPSANANDRMALDVQRKRRENIFVHKPLYVHAGRSPTQSKSSRKDTENQQKMKKALSIKLRVFTR